MPYAHTRDYPEAMIKILLTVIESTPEGGATLQELKEAYREVRDREPSDKTISRMIKRINLLFDPLAYEREGDDPEEEPRAIEVQHHRGRRFYIFTRNLAAPRLDPGLALLLALSIYPQQRNLLPDQFEVLMKLVFESVLQRMTDWRRLRREIERYVYISGYGPANPQKNRRLVERILQAIRLKKRVSFTYRRSSDGQLSERQVEAYGLLCRHNVWYLVGYCLSAKERRIFRLDHIAKLTLVEKSGYTIPPDFSLKDSYAHAWGVWTDNNSERVETVRLRVTAPGLAHKFRVTKYHASQVAQELPDGTLEVSFEVSGAREMIPWLLGWGPALEVLEPAWLREEMRRVLEKMLSAYRSPQPAAPVS